MDMMGTRQSFVDLYNVYDGRLVNIDLWTGLIENYSQPRLMTAEEREQVLLGTRLYQVQVLDRPRHCDIQGVDVELVDLKRLVTFVATTGITQLAFQILFAQIPGGTLDPVNVPKYVTPMLIPPVMPPAGKIMNADYYEISMKQFAQQVLPAPLPE